MRFINLGGVPASGKTLLAHGLLLGIGNGEPFEAFKWIKGSIHHNCKLIVLGKYFTNRALEGTDAIERTAHKRGGPEFIAWALERFPDYNVFCEGERFMKRPFAQTVQSMGVQLEYVFLEIDETVRLERQGQRTASGTQNEKTLRRWNSFYRNWAVEFSPRTLPSNTPQDFERNLATLKEMLGIQGL